MTAGEEGADTVRARLASGERLLVVVAGPNGAGKTTFVETYLKATGLRIVNPDQLARALAPEALDTVSYEAAALAETVRRDLLARGVSFCMETVFSNPRGAKLALLRDARAQGYVVLLIYIGLDTPDLAIARVVERVAAGGHDVPDDKIAARFPRTLSNLRQAVAFVDHAFLFDNSSVDHPFRFVAEFEAGKIVRRCRDRVGWAGELLKRRRS